MKVLKVALTIALSISLFGFAYAGGRGGGGGGGGGGKGGGGGGRSSLGGGSGGGNKGSGSGSSFLPKLVGLGPNGGIGLGNGPKGKSGGNGLGKIKIGIHYGTQRCYHAPVVVVSGPDVLFAPEPVAAEEIASGGTVELPGDWGGEAGYACLMQGETYAYFKVLQWTPKGVKLEVPRLDIKGPIEAELVMVRFDRYAFPRIPVIVYPPLAQANGAVADGAKATDGQAAATKTEQAAQATPAASDVPPEPDGVGTFEQLEKDTTDGKK